MVGVAVVDAEAVVVAVSEPLAVLDPVSDDVDVELGVIDGVGDCDGIVHSEFGSAGFCEQSMDTVIAYPHVVGSDTATKVAAEPGGPQMYVRIVDRCGGHDTPPTRYCVEYCWPDGHDAFATSGPQPLWPLPLAFWLR